MSKDYLQQRLSQIAADHVISPPPMPGWMKPTPREIKEAKATRIRAEEFRRIALENASSVYVIPAGRFVKIGVAMDVQKRWKSLSAANPLLEPVAFATEKLLDAYEVEREAHFALRAYQVAQRGQGRGKEWFHCNRFLAIETIKRIVEDQQ